MLSSLCVWTSMVVGTNIVVHNNKLETINQGKSTAYWCSKKEIRPKWTYYFGYKWAKEAKLSKLSSASFDFDIGTKDINEILMEKIRGNFRYQNIMHGQL